MKSRDMHWALVAHRDQRDVNLGSLRMLVVADGSNPCKKTISLCLQICCMFLKMIIGIFILPLSEVYPSYTSSFIFTERCTERSWLSLLPCVYI